MHIGRLESQLGFDLCESPLPVVDILEALLQRFLLLVERQPLFSRADGADLPCAILARKAEEALVILCEGWSMRDGNERYEKGRRISVWGRSIMLVPCAQRTDAKILGVLIHLPFDIRGDSRRAFVQHSELGQVVEKPGKSHL